MNFTFFMIFNLILMGLYFVLIILHYFWSNRPTALIFLIGILTVSFHNGIYHLLATFLYGVYSPGVISGLIVYIPLNCIFLLLAYRENYINKISGVIILLLSGAIYWIYYIVLGELMIIIYLIISAIYLIIYYIRGTQSSK